MTETRGARGHVFRRQNHLTQPVPAASTLHFYTTTQEAEEGSSEERRLQGLISEILQSLRDNDLSLEVGLGCCAGTVLCDGARERMTHAVFHQMLFGQYATDPRFGDPSSKGITLDGFRALLENELTVNVWPRSRGQVPVPSRHHQRTWFAVDLSQPNCALSGLPSAGPPFAARVAKLPR